MCTYEMYEEMKRERNALVWEKNLRDFPRSLAHCPSLPENTKENKNPLHGTAVIHVLRKMLLCNDRNAHARHFFPTASLVLIFDGLAHV